MRTIDLFRFYLFKSRTDAQMYPRYVFTRTCSLRKDTTEDEFDGFLRSSIVFFYKQRFAGEFLRAGKSRYEKGWKNGKEREAAATRDFLHTIRITGSILSSSVTSSLICFSFRAFHPSATHRPLFPSHSTGRLFPLSAFRVQAIKTTANVFQVWRNLRGKYDPGRSILVAVRERIREKKEASPMDQRVKGIHRWFSNIYTIIDRIDSASFHEEGKLVLFRFILNGLSFAGILHWLK